MRVRGRNNRTRTRGRRSAERRRLVRDPWVLEELCGRRAQLVVELERLLEEVDGFRRDVRGYRRLRLRRSDLYITSATVFELPACVRIYVP